jgi:hypothetical protein
MRRILAAVATFAVSSTLLAGITYAGAKQRHARVAAVKRTSPPPKLAPAKRAPGLGEPLGLRALPVPHFGGY